MRGMDEQNSMPSGRSQWERMIAGALYDASDPDLDRRRIRARRLTARFNASAPDDPAARTAILRELFGRMGEGVAIEPPLYCDYGENVELGDKTFINFGCVLLDCAKIRIGRGVMLAPYVQLYTAHRPLDARERIKGPELASPITIGDHVWIGGGAIVCPGVTIGANTTIGAGSVVTRDIPDGVLAVGNPCRVVRQL